MKIVAVSGGIDSVVMLDYLVNNTDEPILVAHFDHGIRVNSHEDAQFVERLASHYGVQFACRRAELGVNCSESTARAARYDYLKSLAREYNATLNVAHHAEDIIESITINCLRGTGWRGISPMQDGAIERPLRHWRKNDIYRYATDHNLSFRQDPTNVEDNYLRNRIREKMRDFPDTKKQQLLDIYDKQCEIRAQIDEILSQIPQQARYDRALATELEILRYILGLQDIRLTRPQLRACQSAIGTFAPGKRYSVDKNHFVKVNKYTFEITD